VSGLPSAVNDISTLKTPNGVCAIDDPTGTCDIASTGRLDAAWIEARNDAAISAVLGSSATIRSRRAIAGALRPRPQNSIDASTIDARTRSRADATVRSMRGSRRMASASS
jgi:hypothetical protein